MTDNRKCSFYIYPDRNAADRVADGFLEKIPQKERGRAMRAMMLCGAALMKQDERLPFLIAEFLTGSTSMQDIQRIISSTLPQQENSEMARLFGAFLQATTTMQDNVNVEKPASEDKNLEETRKNIQHLFPDDE